jgi:protein phosphatase
LQCLPPAEAAHILVDLANLRGGPDNITVVIVHVKGPLSPGGQSGQPAAPSPPAQPIHPGMWIVLGALVVIGLGLVALQWPWPGWASLAVAALVGAVAALRRYRGGRVWSQWKEQPLGRGPYTATQCVPNAEFAGQLAAVARELRDTTQEAAASENWTVDWNRFNAQMDQAAAASQAGDHAQAVRQYGLAISFLMAELKRQRPAGG